MKKSNTKLESRDIMFNNNINKPIIVLFDSSLFSVFFAIFLVRSPPISESMFINKPLIIVWDPSEFFLQYFSSTALSTSSSLQYLKATAGSIQLDDRLETWKGKSDFTRGVGPGRTNYRQIFFGALCKVFPPDTPLFRTRSSHLFGIVCTIPQQIESRTNCKMQEPVTKTSTDIWRPANRLQESN